jgi:Fe-S-cluster containining protein
MAGLKSDPTDFLDLRPASGVQSDLPKILIRDKPHLLALDSKIAKEDCIFLLEIGHTRKCGIREIRPMGCRTYPFTLGPDGLETVETVLCPWQFWPKGKEKQQYAKDIQHSIQEKEEYANIVEEWNEAHGERGNFLSFVYFALDKLEILNGSIRASSEGPSNVGLKNMDVEINTATPNVKSILPIFHPLKQSSDIQSRRSTSGDIKSTDVNFGLRK